MLNLDIPFRPRAAAAALNLLAALTIGLGTAQATPPAPISDADFPSHSEEKIYLGMVLFYDKILSGNENISCATCHHSLTDTGDGLSLPVGEGGNGLGVARDTSTGTTDAIHERVPRNAPFVFNLGASEFVEMFHDGRVAWNGSYFDSPAGAQLPPGLESALAVQAMFPVTSGAEMAGQVVDGTPENTIAAAADAGNLGGPSGVWEQLADRLKANGEYVALFQAAYPEIDTEGSNINYVHAANAIAAYEDAAFRAINSPFDQYLRGDLGALSENAKNGMDLFYGAAGCSECHSGPLQTDHGYHAIAMPQIGPGKGDGSDGLGDFGREQVTGDPADRYRFRTPSLRNTALTGPWGHAGAYNNLKAVVRHHLHPKRSLRRYDRTQAVLPTAGELLDELDFAHMDNPANVAAIARACEIVKIKLTSQEVADLIAFLHALTDPASLDLRGTVPPSLPSGLPLADDPFGDQQSRRATPEAAPAFFSRAHALSHPRAHSSLR